MVVILYHTLVAYYLFIRDKARFIVRKISCDSGTSYGRPMSMGMTEGLQEASLLLSSVISWRELESTIREAIKLTLPKVSDVVVYLQSHCSNQQELVSTTGLHHTLPKEGITREALEKRRRITASGLDDADPVSGLMNSANSSSPSRKGLLCCGPGWTTTKRKYHVTCCAVEDKEVDCVVCVYIVVCDELSKDDHQNLSFLEKQILVSYKRLQKMTACSSMSAENLQSASTSDVHLMSSPTGPVCAEEILALCGDLYDKDAALLQIKVIQYLRKHTHAYSGFLLLVAPEHRELICQVIGDTVLDEELRFPNNQNSFAHVMTTKKPATLNEIDKNEPLMIRRMSASMGQIASKSTYDYDSHKESLEEVIGFPIESMLCVPVLDRGSGNAAAIICMINKQDDTKEFTDVDIQIIEQCYNHTAAVLHSTITAQNECRLKKKTETMLQVAKNLFTQLGDLTKLLREIMQEARNLTQAERCSVFLLEKETNELVAKVFDGDIRKQKEVCRTFSTSLARDEPKPDSSNASQPKMTTEVRIPADSGIAGYVATTGEMLNIDDAYSHPLFYRGVDESTGFRTRNILCFPIKDETGVIIGVAQLCNKINSAGFSAFDEEIAQAFSIYCCISIVHSLMYKRVYDAHARSQLATELMIYHMQVNENDQETLTQSPIPPPTHFHPDFDYFKYVPRNLSYDRTPLAVHTMLEDMGFITKYRIKRDTLAKFVLMVQKGYRDPPYHNWAHAFAVAHFCYLLQKNLRISQGYLEEIEVFSLFIACLCHDIDHRGTTNSYQVQSDSPLAALYSSEGSVMERHHFAQTMCILNTTGCNIFENATSQEYERILDLMRDIILATDLAHHLRIIKDIEKITEAYDHKNPRHHMLLLCLLMTSCDLSDQTKNWQNTKTIANLIYQEFFRQGDLEKAFGGSPMEMMDREKAYIPELQISFLDHIALPVFTLLGKMFDGAKAVQCRVEKNKVNWIRMNEKVRQLQLMNDSMEIFNLDIDVDDETEEQEMTRKRVERQAAAIREEDEEDEDTMEKSMDNLDS